MTNRTFLILAAGLAIGVASVTAVAQRRGGGGPPPPPRSGQDREYDDRPGARDEDGDEPRDCPRGRQRNAEGSGREDADRPPPPPRRGHRGGRENSLRPMSPPPRIDRDDDDRDGPPPPPRRRGGGDRASAYRPLPPGPRFDGRDGDRPPMPPPPPRRWSGRMNDDDDRDGGPWRGPRQGPPPRTSRGDDRADRYMPDARRGPGGRPPFPPPPPPPRRHRGEMDELERFFFGPRGDERPRRRADAGGREHPTFPAPPPPPSPREGSGERRADTSS
jgi:hypothetical protein